MPFLRTFHQGDRDRAGRSSRTVRRSGWWWIFTLIVILGPGTASRATEIDSPFTAAESASTCIYTLRGPSVLRLDHVGQLTVLPSPIGAITEQTDLTLTPDGRFLYVGGTYFGQPGVVVFDLAARQPTTVVPGEVDRLVSDPLGRFIYGTSRRWQALRLIDTRTNTTATTYRQLRGLDWSSDPIEIVVSADGTRLYVAGCEAGPICVFDAASLDLLAGIDIPFEVVGLALNAAGDHLYATATNLGIFLSVDLVTYNVDVISGVGTGQWLQRQPLVDLFYGATNDSPPRVAIVNSAGVPVDAIDLSARDLAFTPDGAFAVLVENGVVSVLDTATLTVRDTFTRPVVDGPVVDRVAIPEGGAGCPPVFSTETATPTVTPTPTSVDSLTPTASVTATFTPVLNMTGSWSLTIGGVHCMADIVQSANQVTAHGACGGSGTFALTGTVSRFTGELVAEGTASFCGVVQLTGTVALDARSLAGTVSCGDNSWALSGTRTTTPTATPTRTQTPNIDPRGVWILNVAGQTCDTTIVVLPPTISFTVQCPIGEFSVTMAVNANTGTFTGSAIDPSCTMPLAFAGAFSLDGTSVAGTYSCPALGTTGAFSGVRTAPPPTTTHATSTRTPTRTATRPVATSTVAFTSTPPPTMTASVTPSPLSTPTPTISPTMQAAYTGTPVPAATGTSTAGPIDRVLSLAAGNAQPGELLTVTLVLEGEGDRRAATADVEVTFDASILEFHGPIRDDCVIDARLAATHQLGGQLLTENRLLLSFYPLAVHVQTLGEGLLGTCSFWVQPTAAGGPTVLVLEQPHLADVDGNALAVRGAGATALVLGDTPTPTAPTTAAWSATTSSTPTMVTSPSSTATTDPDPATPALTPTTLPTPTHPAEDTVTPSVCAGDCDGDGIVTVAELTRGVMMSLGTLTSNHCPALDRDHNGHIRIEELVAAVHAALGGC